MTAVYKYADAVMKTLASAVTTVVMMVASAAFFGMRPTATNVAGCITVVIAVALYSTTPQNAKHVTVLDVKKKRIAASNSNDLPV